MLVFVSLTQLCYGYFVHVTALLRVSLGVPDVSNCDGRFSEAAVQRDGAFLELTGWGRFV